nr:unnamed protein product [Digitaria exilis]
MSDAPTHRLWILGNVATLSGSGSIWEELVLDAVEHQYFFNWEDDNGITFPIPPGPSQRQLHQGAATPLASGFPGGARMRHLRASQPAELERLDGSSLVAAIPPSTSTAAVRSTSR